MTELQINTLLYFAQNFSMLKIARKFHVSIAAIKNRLERIQEHYPNNFDNALSIRNANKRLKEGLLNPSLYDKDMLDSLPKNID